MIIRERRAGGDTVTHRLEGSSRQIYIFCSHHRPLQHILTTFSPLSSDQITSFLQMMTSQKLMFSENDHFLSLAVPVRIAD